MDMKMLARLGAVAFGAVVILATAFELGREENELSQQSTAPDVAADSLRGELMRCQLLGEAGIHDTACLRAWAESRRRFIAPAAVTPERK